MRKKAYGIRLLVSHDGDQWLFNTGLTLPLQVCMMKHLQSIFGIEPANFSTALSKLAKDAAHKYRIIGLDEEAQPSPASFFGFFNVPTHQSPESPLSGVYGISCAILASDMVGC